MSKRTAEVLAEKLGTGLTLEAARESTILEIGLEIGKRLAHAPLEDALTALGLEKVLAPKIVALALTKSMAHLTEAFMVVVSGGGAAGVPKASCLARHLPPGRHPTKEEVEEAIAACRRESQAKG